MSLHIDLGPYAVILGCHATIGNRGKIYSIFDLYYKTNTGLKKSSVPKIFADCS